MLPGVRVSGRRDGPTTSVTIRSGFRPKSSSTSRPASTESKGSMSGGGGGDCALSTTTGGGP
jgi:hypothetical protein